MTEVKEDKQLDEQEALRDELLRARKEQSASIAEILREAIRNATDTANPDAEPLKKIVGLLDPKPLEEWGTPEYANVIVSLQNVQGEPLEARVADDIQSYMVEMAEHNNITRDALMREVANQSSGVSARMLSDFAEQLLLSYGQMTSEQRSKKMQELEALPEEQRNKINEMLTKAQDIVGLRTHINVLKSQPQVKSPQEEYYEERNRLALREQAAEKRIYEEEGEDYELYNGAIHETIERRMERILNNPNGEDEDTLRKYYADLQKWVGIVLNNDFREDPENGKLVLKNTRYEQFKKIVETEFEAVDINELIANTRYLQNKDEGRLTTYFLQKDGSKNERINPVIGFKQEGDLPSVPNFEETMDLIQRQYGSKFATGGEYQLIDVKGEFHLENFAYWARERTNFLKEQNPAGAIDPLGKITIRTLYSEIPLGSILESPQFRKQRRFVITGNEDEGDKDVKIDGHWGREVDHPEFTEDKSLDLLYELAFYSQEHSMAAEYQTTRGEKNTFLETTKKHMNSWIARGNWTTIFKRPTRQQGTGSEFKAYHDENADGTMGRAMREMIVAYNHMTEFTEYYTYQEGDRRLTLKDGVTREVGKRKVFKDNLFYKFLEADGANGFLLGLSSEAMKKNMDVIKMYQSYICERLDVAADKLQQRDNISSDQKKRLGQLLEKYKKRVNGNSKIDTDFYKSTDLESFHLQVQQQVFRDSKVDKNQISLDVQEDMITNLKSGLFEKIKHVKVAKYDKTGRKVGMQDLGDVEVKINEKDGTKLSVAQALDEFDSDYDRFKKYVWYSRLNDIEKQRGKAEVHENPDITSADFEKYVEKNERLASVLCEAIGTVSRKELNYFRKSGNFFSKTEVFDAALQKGIGEVGFGMNKVDTSFGGGWAKNMLFGFGIAGQNDTTATGFDYWTRITNASDYMKQQNMKAYPIVEPFINEVKFLGTNMFDMLMVSRPGEPKAQMTLLDIFTGGVGDEFVSRKERILDPDMMYNIEANAQSNVFQNNIRNAADFIDKLRNADFHFDKITTTDFNGNVVIDTKRAISEFTKLWTMIRYSTDQHAMDYTRLMSRNGKIDDVMHHQFGKHSRSLIQEMQDTMYDDPMALYRTPGIGVFAALVGAVMEEHRGTTYEKRWTIQQINEMEYLIGGIIHKDPRIKKYKTRIPPHIWDAMLVVHGIGFKKMMATETGFSIVEALYFAMMEAIEDYSEQVAKPLKN